MKRQTTVIITAFLLLLSACMPEEGREPGKKAGATVSFTATADTPETKAASSSPLENNANVTVHAWTAALSAGAGVPVLSNNYTVDNSEATDVLKEKDAPMKVQTGVDYYFYALSTNSATAAVPALNGGSRTGTLKNGVDYLMATATGKISESGGEHVTVPLSFRHLATQVTLVVTPASADGYIASDGLSVSIADTDPAGSYIDLSAGTGSPALVINGTPGDLPDDQTATAAKNGTQFTVSFIILPVKASTRGIPLKLDFTNLSFEAGKVIGSKSYTASILPNTGETSLTLEGGYCYRYEVKIARYSATFGVPEVEPWEMYGVDMDKIELDPQ